MAFSSSMASSPLAAFTRSSRPQFAPAKVSRALRTVTVRAEKDAMDTIKEKTKEFVEETQRNSGLTPEVLGNQKGNESSSTYATTEIDTPKGELAEVFSFSGLLPEIINGRAAMVGMLAAFGAELATHQPVFVQIQKTPVAILAAFATIVVASLAPVLRNADLNKQGAGPFTSEAEVLNGRTAMVAFALLIIVETWKAGPGLVP